ncbi:hypothetical protein [Azospirillum halopraeferens]|uniref:hypothetical protein n=1 Tax=Azospirillum halopraeferens TaxID=34010 RepID=UPI00040CDCC8|nr:hypothetical protein [Azospirillum halopraeferens]
MTLKEFNHCADLYGGAIDRWPAPHRGEAMSLLRTSDEARAILAEAVALDTLLDRAAPVMAQASERRVLDAIARHIDGPPPSPGITLFAAAAPVRFWPAAGLLAIMAMAGIAATSQGLWPAQTACAVSGWDIVVTSGYTEMMR